MATFAAVLIIAYIVGGLIGRIISGVRSSAERDRPDYGNRTAGVIHLFSHDQELSSSPDNPYDHSLLDWDSGNLGTVLWDDLAKADHYHPALVGIIEIRKPAEDCGKIAALLDNRKVRALGYDPVGLSLGAEWVADARRSSIRPSHFA